MRASVELSSVGGSSAAAAATASASIEKREKAGHAKTMANVESAAKAEAAKRKDKAVAASLAAPSSSSSTSPPPPQPPPARRLRSIIVDDNDDDEEEEAETLALSHLQQSAPSHAAVKRDADAGAKPSVAPRGTRGHSAAANDDTSTGTKPSTTAAAAQLEAKPATAAAAAPRPSLRRPERRPARGKSVSRTAPPDELDAAICVSERELQSLLRADNVLSGATAK